LWPPPHPGYLFPYLLWFHQAPAHGGDEWHLHAHTAPPLRAPGTLRFVASGELGSGFLQNPVVPEDAAKALRDA
jgi:UDPglucose--hexose-1-phosphate uridylyltransferase